MPALVSLIVGLGADRPPKVEHVHGLVSGWLEGGRSLEEHRANRKAFRLAPPTSNPDGSVEIRIGLMNDCDDLPSLCTAAMDQAEVRLGSARGPLCGRLDEGGPIRSLRRSRWVEMLEESAPNRAWRFTLRSPTAFRSGRITNPLPSPTLIFGHLRDRWEAFAPADLQPSVVLSDCGLAVRQLEGRTQPWRVRTVTRPGFVGMVEIVATAGTERDHRVLDALTRLTPFAGIGANTTMGMGDGVCVPLD